MNEFRQTILLADGTELAGTAGLDEGKWMLWVWLTEEDSLNKAFSIFSKPKKTAKITARISEREEKTWEGFTAINLIREEAGGISLRMRRG